MTTSYYVFIRLQVLHPAFQIDTADDEDCIWSNVLQSLSFLVRVCSHIGAQVRSLLQHDPSRVIFQTRLGTLALLALVSALSSAALRSTREGSE